MLNETVRTYIPSLFCPLYCPVAPTGEVREDWNKRTRGNRLAIIKNSVGLQGNRKRNREKENSTEAQVSPEFAIS